MLAIFSTKKCLGGLPPKVRWIGVAMLIGSVVFSVATPNVEPLPTESHRARQPVQEYFNVYSPTGAGRQKIEMTVNPFLAYTHLGTDFGFIGSGKDAIGWEPGIVCASMPSDQWGGMWHSLAGVADDKDDVLDFRACYPDFIEQKYQPKIVGLELRARGRGMVKLEIKTCRETTRWIKHLSIDSHDLRTFASPVDPSTIECAKYFNWVAEGGADVCIDALSFIVETPAVPYDEYVFLASYAKLARCFNERNGFVKDRAHSREGYFENVPACGLFALCTAVASNMGVVAPERAHKIIEKTRVAVSALDSARGLLPHFVKENADHSYRILPGTEFSVVDTSLYYHAMLLAARVLKDGAMEKKLSDAVRKIEFGDLVDTTGFIKHGLREDGTTPLPFVWRDWSGETALVQAMNAMTSKPVPPHMDDSGHFYQGTGFLAEIQSAFYPDFDSAEPDALTKQNWLGARKTLFDRQKAYFPQTQPASLAAKDGFYGLSAGEARYGMGYSVGGVDMPNQHLIHPHYVLMSAGLEKEPSTVYALLRKMEDHALFPPWGMVEQFSSDTLEYLPMQGALNAAFECLGAAHLLSRNRKTTDVIYEASRACPLLRKGAAVFYPPTVTKS